MQARSLLGDAIAGVRGLARYRGARDVRGGDGVEAVLVHGYGSHPGHLQAWARIAAGSGCSVRHVAYRPWESYDDVVLKVAVMLESASVRGVPGIVLAHSLGGVVARDAMSRQEHLVQLAVSVGSPHHGSRWAGWSRGCAAAVEPGSAELSRLTDAWVAREDGVRWVTIGMTDDVVVPAESAVLKGAETVVLDRVGHLGALEDPRVLAVLEGEIRECVRRNRRTAR